MTHRTKCRCSKHNSTQCAWSQNVSDDIQCQQIPDQCEPILEAQNIYTEIICSKGYLAGSICTWKCDKYFRLNKKGRYNECRCQKPSRGSTNFTCSWKNSVAATDDQRWCAPAPSFFRRLDRRIRKVNRSGNDTLVAELETNRVEVSKWL